MDINILYALSFPKHYTSHIIATEREDNAKGKQ